MLSVHRLFHSSMQLSAFKVNPFVTTRKVSDFSACLGYFVQMSMLDKMLGCTALGQGRTVSLSAAADACFVPQLVRVGNGQGCIFKGKGSLLWSCVTSQILPCPPSPGRPRGTQRNGHGRPPCGTFQRRLQPAQNMLHMTVQNRRVPTGNIVLSQARPKGIRAMAGECLPCLD